MSHTIEELQKFLLREADMVEQLCKQSDEFNQKFQDQAMNFRVAANALGAVVQTLAWARHAYGWESFWVDMKWKPETTFEANGKALRDFIKDLESYRP